MWKPQRVADSRRHRYQYRHSTRGARTQPTSQALPGMRIRKTCGPSRPCRARRPHRHTGWTCSKAKAWSRRAVNQYYLAAKYGGFPQARRFRPGNSYRAARPRPGGTATVEYPNLVRAPRRLHRDLSSALTTTTSRVARMRWLQSLTEAFARIAAELRSSATSVATNSTRLGADTAVFQASFDSTNWSGDVQAFRVLSDGSIDHQHVLERRHRNSMRFPNSTSQTARF